MQFPAPRHFTAQGTLPTMGTQTPRDARMASRRAFAELKQTFLAAIADLQDPRTGWLCAQVRSAEEPVDLWLLRAPLFEALSGTDPERRRRRQMVRRGLDSVFHDSEPPSAFSAL